MSTPDLLVKHLYNETDSEEATLLQHSLENDSKSTETYRQLQEAKAALDEADGETPGNSIIQNILEYSKQQELSTAE